MTTGPGWLEEDCLCARKEAGILKILIILIDERIRL